jgi:hypothetical protein
MGFKDEALNTDAGAQPYGEIFVMRYDGTQVEQLTDNQWEDGGPAWRPKKANQHAATSHEHVHHWELNASRGRPAFSSHLINSKQPEQG